MAPEHKLARSVDNSIAERLVPAIQSHGRDWDLLIAHFLGGKQAAKRASHPSSTSQEGRMQRLSQANPNPITIPIPTHLQLPLFCESDATRERNDLRKEDVRAADS